VRPVDLLPVEQRPHRATGARAGSAYVLLGALAILLGAAVLFVATLNQVNDREGQIADAKRERAAAEARSGELSPVARFLEIKQTREASVRQLAAQRFDWERLVRELSRLTPSGVYLQSFDGSTDGTTATGGAATASSTPTAAAAGAQPQLGVVGCADSQPDVATLLVRYRRLHSVDDVKLKASKDERVSGGSGAGNSAAGGDRCPRFRFEAQVTFKAPAPEAAPKRVPASLGGGQ
jgi:Tfp pilus assembly protein PilN